MWVRDSAIFEKVECECDCDKVGDKKIIKKILIYIFYIFTIKIFLKNTLDSQKKKRKKNEKKKKTRSTKQNTKQKRNVLHSHLIMPDHALRICHVYPSNHNVSHQGKMTKAAT